MSQDYEILKQTYQIMNEILKWLKFIGNEKIRKIINENFKKDYEFLLYDMSDGKKATRELAEKLPISKDTITTYWDKWTELGIMEKVPVQGGGTRGKKIFTLSELGIDIPKIK